MKTFFRLIIISLSILGFSCITKLKMEIPEIQEIKKYNIVGVDSIETFTVELIKSDREKGYLFKYNIKGSFRIRGLSPKSLGGVYIEKGGGWVNIQLVQSPTLGLGKASMGDTLSSFDFTNEIFVTESHLNKDGKISFTCQDKNVILYLHNN